jgi:hypothetical protein
MGTRRRLRASAATLGFALVALVGSGPAAASTPHDLTGTWSCCGPGGASGQAWTITSMDKTSGSFSGTGQGGSIQMIITGTASGDSVTLLTDYVGSSYDATFKGTLSADSKSMSGTWESNASQKGTWTATRPSAPTPGDPSNPSAPKPDQPGGTKTKATPGDIYVVDSSANSGLGAVYKVNPENGQSVLVHVGLPFNGIRNIAYGPEGNLFVTDTGAHAIDKIDLKTGAVTAITPPLNPLLRAPWGIVYEPLLGEFLVTDVTLGTVVRVDPKTGEVKPAASEGGLKMPHGIALELGGPAYVADFKAAAVIKVARTGGDWKAGTFKKGPPFAAPEALALDGSRFYLSDAIAPGGLSGATSVSGVGGLFTWIGSGAPDLLYQPTTGGGILRTPLGLAPSADGKTMYIGSTGGLPGTGAIVEMNLATKKLKLLAGGFASPLSIAVAPPKAVAAQVGTTGNGANATPNGVTVNVISPQQPVAAVVSVSVNMPGGFGAGARASKAVKVKSVTKPVPAGKRTAIRVAFKGGLRKQIKAALQAGKKIKAKVAITATGASGSTRKTVKRVPIKLGR